MRTRMVDCRSDKSYYKVSARESGWRAKEKHLAQGILVNWRFGEMNSVVLISYTSSCGLEVLFLCYFLLGIHKHPIVECVVKQVARDPVKLIDLLN